MIKFFKATQPSRKRDKKHPRFILQVGSRMFHMSRAEALSLAVQMKNLLNKAP